MDLAPQVSFIPSLLFVVFSAFLLFSLCHLHGQISDESLGSVCWWKLQRDRWRRLFVVGPRPELQRDGWREKWRPTVIISAKQVEHYPCFSIKTSPQSPDTVVWIKLKSSFHRKEKVPHLQLSFGQKAKKSKLLSKWANKHPERRLLASCCRSSGWREEAGSDVSGLSLSNSFVDVS